MMTQDEKKLELGPLAYFSHELRTPLNAILGYTDLMRRQIHGPIPETYKDFLEGIQTSGHHLLAMINNILDYAKIQSGSMTIHPQSVDLKKLTQTCLKMMTGLAQDKNITLNFHAENKLPIVTLDETLTRQIIVNLISNAIKFSPKKTVIDIKIKHGDKEILIEIYDQGIGMTQDQIDVALTPYGQVHNKKIKKQEGTGLGLPLVKAICDMHQAQLSIVSEQDKGTTMRIHIPEALWDKES